MTDAARIAITLGDPAGVGPEIIAKALASLQGSPYLTSYGHKLEPRVGTNRKRQLNLYDPDGTRVELMEPDTIDGQPVPPSTAPLPVRKTE